MRDRAKIEELWQPHLKAWFPDGVDTPDIALLKVSVEKAEYWDSSQSMVVHAVSLVSSLVTGEPAQPGEGLERARAPDRLPQPDVQRGWSVETNAANPAGVRHHGDHEVGDGIRRLRLGAGGTGQL